MTFKADIRNKLEKAMESLDDINRSIASGNGGEIHQIDIDSVKTELQDASNLLQSIEQDRREGLVVTKNAEGIIACVTWQEDHEIVEVIAESCGYPDIKAREEQALEAIQNLMGAFDNPIVRRKVGNEFSQEAIKSGQVYLEEHGPDEDDHFKEVL